LGEHHNAGCCQGEDGRENQTETACRAVKQPGRDRDQTSARRQQDRACRPELDPKKAQQYWQQKPHDDGATQGYGSTRQSCHKLHENQGEPAGE
jgi:hypothetical protein